MRSRYLIFHQVLREGLAQRFRHRSFRILLNRAQRVLASVGVAKPERHGLHPATHANRFQATLFRSYIEHRNADRLTPFCTVVFAQHALMPWIGGIFSTGFYKYGLGKGSVISNVGVFGLRQCCNGVAVNSRALAVILVDTPERNGHRAVAQQVELGEAGNRFGKDGMTLLFYVGGLGSGTTHYEMAVPNGGVFKRMLMTRDHDAAGVVRHHVSDLAGVGPIEGVWQVLNVAEPRAICGVQRTDNR